MDKIFGAPRATLCYDSFIMKHMVFAVVLCWSMVTVTGGSALAQSSTAGSASSSASEQRALLDAYCVTCHNARTRQAGLALDEANVQDVAQDPETWEKVVTKLTAGAMPPLGMPRPDGVALRGFRAWLERSLDDAAAREPNPGRPAVHRLNRTEYTNAIRDLLALAIDADALLPPDTTGFGFDNIADVLSVSPGLLERYLAAARKISRLALGDVTIRPGLQIYRVPYMVLRQDDRTSEEQPFGSRGGTIVQHHFPVNGEYEISVTMQRGYLTTEPRGLPTFELVDIRLDGERVALLPIGGEDAVGPDPYNAAPKPPADEHLRVRLSVTAGLHTIGVTFQQRRWAPEGVGPSRFPAASFGTQSARRTNTAYGRVEMAVDTVQVEGPFENAPAAATASRQAIFSCHPRAAAAVPGAQATDNESACARRILTRLARRAYRRPVTTNDVETLMTFYGAGRTSGGFETGIQLALERILVSPYFLFRIELDPQGAQAGAVYRISDVELASRLSFFLWSSIPDEPLLSAAKSGRLSDPVVLDEQIARMMTDPRFDALVENFFGQWLYVRNVRSHQPDPKAFMEFDENLRRAFMTETKMFAASQVREDRSVTELLIADYTFVNERLARHYDIPNVYGPRFRRVSFPDNRRAGILGQGSLLSVTSMATRTSPVKRGAWLLEHLLGTPPPPPAPNVPALEESDEDTKVVTSLRERMEQHRRNPVCAACHSKMDPLGFALENFDGVGRWRDNDGENALDASGTLPDGTPFSGPAEFRSALLQRSDLFVTTVARKLLTYAMGRGVEYYDMPAVREIVRNAAAHDYRWSSLIEGIVKSMPFRMRRASS